MQEVKSAALFVKVLKEEGFQVEEGICGIPTAFSASYGSGKSVIGFLAEYDALSGLSQEAGSTEYHELVKGGSGHGCGHNLLGAGCFAAAAVVPLPKNGSRTIPPTGQPAKMHVSASLGGYAAKCPP